jgi:3-hydroxypropanoate dehydrogenase
MSDLAQAAKPDRRLPEDSLNQLFYSARSYSAWLDKEVTVEQLHELFSLLKMGPTSANGCPARFLFLTSNEAKQRLAPALMPKNLDKTLAAPVTVIVAWDTEFYEVFGKLTADIDWKSFFVGKQDLIESTVFRNSSLQGAPKSMKSSCPTENGNQIFFAISVMAIRPH